MGTKGRSSDDTFRSLAHPTKAAYVIDSVAWGGQSADDGGAELRRLGPFLMAALLSAFGSVASAAGETCASGDELLGAGLVDQALSVFIARKKLDDECPAGQPPESGIERAERQRAQAQSLLTQAKLVAKSDPGQAIADLSSALAFDQGLVAAEEELAKLLVGEENADNPYAGAVRLAEMGLDDAARTEAAKVAAENPEASVPPELDYLSPDPLRDFRRSAAPIATLWPILLLVVLALWVWKGRDAAFMRFGRRLQLTDPVGADGQVPVGVKSVIAGEITTLAKDGAGNGLNFVSGPDSPLDLPADIIGSVAGGKFLAAVLSAITPPPWTLATNVLFDPTRGTGLRLVLSDPLKRAHSLQEIWESDFNQPLELIPDAAPTGWAAAHAFVARAAGAWVAFAMTERRDAHRKRLHAAASANWRSYALFRIGAESQDTDRKQASAYYDRALSLDPANPGANFNSAFLQLAGGNLVAAKARLGKVTDSTKQMEAAGLEKQSNHPLWYRAAYNLSVIDYETVLARAPKARTKAAWSGVVASAHDVTLRAAQRAYRGRFRSSALRELVLLVEESAGLMLAGAVSERAGAPPPEENP
jgi:tetratricopeptide (TPR) repeat protein